MRSKTLALFLVMILATGTAWAKDKKDGKLETEKDKLSYVLGTDIAVSLKLLKDEVVLDKVYQGIEDAFAGKELLVSDAEKREIMISFSQKMQQKMVEEAKVAGEKNKVEGESFLNENKEKDGVVTTSSGLQYVILKEGDGATPTVTDTVKVHYHGTTINDEVFDSSIDRGEPISFPVNGVIKGWTEALQLMKVGSKYKLFIPSDLAYGERGAGPKIGPNSVLIFEVELLGIE